MAQPKNPETLQSDDELEATDTASVASIPEEQWAEWRADHEALRRIHVERYDEGAEDEQYATYASAWAEQQRPNHQSEFLRKIADEDQESPRRLPVS